MVCIWNAELKPPHIEVVCDCGAGYENGDYTYKGTTRLYTEKWASWFKALKPEMWCMWMWDNLFWWSINKRNIFLLQQNMYWTWNWMGLCFHGSEDKSFFYQILHRNDMLVTRPIQSTVQTSWAQIHFSSGFFPWISVFKIRFQETCWSMVWTYPQGLGMWWHPYRSLSKKSEPQQTSYRSGWHWPYINYPTQMQ